METILIEPNGKFKSSNSWENIQEIETLEVNKKVWENNKSNNNGMINVKIIEFKNNKNLLYNSYNYDNAKKGQSIFVFKRAFKVKNEVKEIENFFNF